MNRIFAAISLMTLVFLVDSCKREQSSSELFKVKLRRDGGKEIILYDTMVSLDYLAGASPKYNGVSNFEFFDSFDYPMLGHELETDSLLRLFNDSISISIKTTAFDSVQFQRNLATDSNYYKGKPFYGGLNDSQEFPSRTISQISISVHGKTNQIPYSHYENMFTPNLGTNGIDEPATRAYMTERGEILLQMDNGAGAEFYYLIFLFDRDGNLKNRLVKNVL